MEGFIEDTSGVLVSVLTVATDEAQLYELEGQQVEVLAGYVLVSTEYGVFMLPANSKYGRNSEGKLITVGPDGTPSELGP